MKRNSGNRKKKSRKVVVVILSILLVIALCFCGEVFLRREVRKNCEKDMAEATVRNRKEVVEELSHRIVYLDILSKQLSGIIEENTKLTDMALMKKEASALDVGFYFDSEDVFYLSDGTKGVFQDDMMRKSISNSKYAILSVNVKELGNKTCLAIVLPIYEKEKVCGMVFGYFDMKEFIEIFSRPVYEDHGFSFLADKNGNIIVPASAFSSIDENGVLHIDGNDNSVTLKDMMQNISVNGESKVAEKATELGDCFVYGVALEEYTDLAVIALVDTEIIYKNTTRISVGVTGLAAFIVLALLIQLIVVLRNDRTKRKEIAEAINYDELTGIPNKPYHKEQCEAILKKNKGKFAYAVVDVADFTAINTACGYKYGNMVLQNIAEVLTEELDKNECCSRTSADHFAILFKYDNQESLTQRVYSICEKAGSLPESEAGQNSKIKKQNIIFNCGIYLIQNNNEDINRIRARANTARKNLRKSINTQISFYNEDDFRKKMENHELEMDLLKAVDNNELVVFFQPKYGAVSEKITGAEALVRWNHPTRGMMGPNTFIPIAEADGFVKKVDFFVFETVCKQLKEWKNKGYKMLPVSINFSRLHLYDEDFVQAMTLMADKYGVEHQYLEIELTETADFNDMNELLNVMYRIKDAGFGLAMDDFGSGYSSLQLLMKMPTGVLKMDKSLIDDCSKDNEADNKMAADIISLAQGRGHSVVAEGVETQEQKDILRDANCDMIQGYYYSKPITVDAFERLLAE